MSNSSPANSAPVFVVGFYRSGTSLLHALLNRHPDLALMYECDVLKLWPFVRAAAVRRDWVRLIDFWNGAISRHQIDPATLPVAPHNRAEAALALYGAYAAQKGARLCGEKSPYYYDHLPALLADFPRARLIVLWRSPLDTLRSIRRAAETERFFARKDFARRVIVGMKIMAADCARLRATGADLHEVQYHALVREQRPTLEGICQFLGLPFDERMTELAGADISVLPQGGHHDNVRSGRIVAGGPRTEVLSADEIALLESSCENLPGAPWAHTGGRPADPAALELSAAERAEARRWAWRDAAVRAVYAGGPLRAFEAWRAWRSRRFAATNASPGNR